MVKYPELLVGRPPPARRSWWRRLLSYHISTISVGLMALLLLIVVLWPYMVITVPSGQVGVMWYRFLGFDTYCWCFAGRGTALNPREIREEGLHLIAPWNKMFLYDLRLQSTTQTYNAISKDGVSIRIEINTRFQLLHNSVGVLHKFIGPAYVALVVAPEVGSQARQVISEYTAQQVYVSREEIQNRIRDAAQKSLGAHLNTLVQPEAVEELDPKHYTDFLQNSIQILDTLVLSIQLPPEIVAAINRQTEEYYMIQEYKFRVSREAEESKRKQIEANGIAAFQQTVSKGISPSYLRWRGIEATLALARSPNSKIIVIGSGKDGLPIILGNTDYPPAPQQQPAPPVPPPAPGSSEETAPTPAPVEGSREAAPAAQPPPAAPAPTQGRGKPNNEPQQTTPPNRSGAAGGNGNGSTEQKTGAEQKSGSFNPLSLPAIRNALSRLTGGGSGAGGEGAAVPNTHQ
jgi:prohibitin 2